MDIVASSSAESGLHFKSSRCSGSWPNIGRGSGHHRKDGWKWGMLYTTYTASIMMCHIFIYIYIFVMCQWNPYFGSLYFEELQSCEIHSNPMNFTWLPHWCASSIRIHGVSLKISHLIAFTALIMFYLFPYLREPFASFLDKPNYNLALPIKTYPNGRFISHIYIYPLVITHGSLENALQLMFHSHLHSWGDCRFPCPRFAPGTPKTRKNHPHCPGSHS